MEWKPDISARRGPRFKAIADGLAEDIKTGLLDPGTRLPAHQALAGWLGVNASTVARAYAEAGRRGLVAVKVGRGTFVTAPCDKAPAMLQDPALPHDPFMLHDDALLLLNKLDPEPVPAPKSPLPAFGASEFVDPGHPRPAQGPQGEALAATLMALGSSADLSTILADASQASIRTNQAAGADWFARLGISVPADRVHPTASAQQALHAVFAMLGTPGDIVLTDALTYPGLLPIAALLGLKLHCVLGDDDGMLPDSLQLACWSSGARLLYLMPTLHDPTTVTMPKQRRLELVEIARKYDVRIVEDEVCGALARDRIESFTTLAAERSFCVASLSMGLAPGIRAGFVIAPYASTAGLRSAIEAIDARPGLLQTAVAARWIGDGTVDRLFDWQRKELAARNEIAGEMLAGQRFRGNPVAPHIWLDLPDPWRTDDFAQQLAGQKVSITPSAPFAPDRATAPQAVRISLGAAPDRETLRKGLAAVVLGLDETASAAA